jgi:hypothetical protein
MSATAVADGFAKSFEKLKAQIANLLARESN